MRKLNTLFIALFLFVVFSCSEQKSEQKIQPVKFKKEKKDPNVRHKKGIEHMADYQAQIRKPINAEQSTYKKGYLSEEFKKAVKQQVQRKSAKTLNPVFKERGPVNVPGRTRGIAVDPTNTNRWFVGTVSGGVWLTEDAGATWSNLTDMQIPNLSTSTIVMSPQDPNTLYVGTGEPFGNLGAVGGSGVYKTIDGGATWAQLPFTQFYGDVGRIIINPNDKDNVLIGTTSGIYRTENGGSSWIQVYFSNNTVQDLDADPSNFNIQYGSVASTGIVKSTDGGLTWSLVFDKDNFNTNHRRFELSVSSADPNTVYVSVYTPNSAATTGVNTDFYVTRNKGTSFSLLNPPTLGAAANLVTGQGWYDNIIMAHPFDANIFYVGGIAVFKVTVTNNNYTFKSIASGYDNTQLNPSVHVDQHGLEYIKGSGQEFRIVLANDGGVYSTSFRTDPGVNHGDWSDSNIGKNSTQFYGATKQNGQDNYIAGAQDNGSWISLGNSADKTKVYNKLFGGDGFEVIWHYNNPGDYLVTSQFNNIARFVNNSGSISNFPSARDSRKSPFYSKISSVDNNPDVIFTVTTEGVWRSTDFATSWSLTAITDRFAQNSTSALNVEPSVADPNVVWAGSAMTQTGAYGLFVSEDNGLTFKITNSFDNQRKQHNYFISGLATSPTNRNRAYALFSSQGAAKILKTEDLGNTWTDISGITTLAYTGFPDVAVHSLLEMPFDKNILWAGTDIGIFETLDGGANWNLINGFIPVAVYDMKIVNDQVVLSTYGRGVWSATLAELSNYTLPIFLKNPTITTVQKEIGSLKTKVTYNVTSNDVNRVKIFIDDTEQAEITQDFNMGETYQYETSDLSEGVHQIAVQLFVDATTSQTIITNQAFEVVDFDTPSTSVGISEFSTTDVYAFDSSFKIDNMNNAVTNVVLNNSDHPYQNGKVYATVLKKPLVISEANKNFTYEDMAIVEPYTDNLADLNSFYDYVIIEASTDLQNWKTLDKYDARRFSEWLDEFNKGTAATASDNLFKSQTIVLTDKGFAIGDTIVIRFSLVTDPGATSFGWAIRSIEEATASINDVLKDKKTFTIYPTISNGNFSIFAKNSLGKSTLQIVDLTGREVHKETLDFKTAGKQAISVNLNSGVYLVNLIDESNKRTSQKIIIE